ncbi:hypothetical protein RFI_11376 [Reticulomyxa filosa]|uniref:Uncharacterized protein n=1 Tax=Reticulomyxa filosa TaxID=46433 RepID=X6NJ44_RETFI|nr:hypothetical protein RFI_11376 [Reticulomyxa filosa]|eukprot:ETO25764.1 hypothetical protein RFI_11376 [Reticulomyxa filosa]
MLKSLTLLVLFLFFYEVLCQFFDEVPLFLTWKVISWLSSYHLKKNIYTKQFVSCISKEKMNNQKQNFWSSPLALAKQKMGKKWDTLSQMGIFSVSVMVGALLPIQSGINLVLSRMLSHPLRGAFMSFLVGSIVLSFAWLPKIGGSKDTPTAKQSLTNLLNGLKENKRNLFVFGNGLCGVYAVVSGIYLPPLVGFSLFNVCMVSMQLLSSLIIDWYCQGTCCCFIPVGTVSTSNDQANNEDTNSEEKDSEIVLPTQATITTSPPVEIETDAMARAGTAMNLTKTVESKKVSIWNKLGIVCMFGGVLLFQAPFRLSHNDHVSSKPYLYVLLLLWCMTLGITLTTQTTLNRKLREFTRSPLRSSSLSFYNGTLVLLVLSTLTFVNEPHLHVSCDRWFCFVYWIGGGLIGSTYVTLMTILPTYLGFFGTFVGSICGNFASSILLDALGGFGVPARPITGFQLAGASLVISAVLLVNAKFTCDIPHIRTRLTQVNVIAEINAEQIQSPATVEVADLTVAQSAKSEANQD